MNNEYRQYLIKNTNTIMQKNYQVQNQNNIQSERRNIKMEIINSRPYLFNGIHDDKMPYGYETSHPKEIYLSQQQIENQKRLPLQNDIR